MPVSTAIRKYIKHNEGHEHFVLKDLCRTCKRLMVDAMINRETRNLIQGHGLTGIDFKHYAHSKHLSEKQQGLQTFTEHFQKVIVESKDVG